MAKIVFELRADAGENFAGSVSLPGGKAYDVGKALSSGGGRISLDPGKPDDERLIGALRNYPPLKESAGGGSASKSKDGDR